MMTERDFLRLRELVGPLIGQLPPHLRAEALRLLKGPPASDLFPPPPPFHRPAVAREEVRCGEPHHSSPERF